MIRLFLICWFICGASLVGVQGQSLSNVRQKKIAVQAIPLVLDSLSIVPGTFFSAGIAANTYKLDATNSIFQWLIKPNTDSVSVSYRVFPYKLNSSTYRYRYDSILNFFKIIPGKGGKASDAAASNKFIDFGTMNYSGSLGRSLSFGNSQDAVVNSLFNLQIDGMLGDSIQIAAAITDNNIPIQPDGTTQQLNEFDRIFLQFKKRNWKIDLGDIDMRQQPTYFLNYYKRQQGIAINTKNKLTKNIASNLTASGAIAKGKFTRNIFQGEEGNQGPYRLKGANNELYFMLLAGTEKVFIDGVQMQRGEDQDYVINYNTAEITFTPKQLITKDKRIQVEFEYADRNYLNSLIYIGDEFTYKNKARINLAWYSNSDAKNSPINQNLDKDQKQFLSDIGDSIQRALYPVAVRDTFSITKILYVQIDTVVNSIAYPKIFRYQSYYDTALYNLSFSEVGQGFGDYVPAYDAANGKVYQWVAPIGGVKQGNYAPVTLLVTPKKQQLFTGGVEYKLTKQTLVRAEAALSIYDVNTFSSRNSGDDIGQGLKLLAFDNRNINLFSKKLNLQTTGGYEYVSKVFKPLERLRTVEFLRDWGLPYETGSANEHLPTFSFVLGDSANNSFRYAYTGYYRSDKYQGSRHELQHAANYKGFVLKDVFNITTMQGSQSSGYFLRPTVEISKVFPKLNNYELGASYALQHYQLKAIGTDSLLANSFSFQDWNAFIRSDVTKKNKWSLSWYSRQNKQALGRQFVPLDVNHTFSGLVEMLKSEHHQFRITTTYRILEVKNQLITTQKSENNILGRGEYMVNIWKTALAGNLLYEIGNGQEQRRDFSYFEVPAGTGEFAWIDYNNDGVPQLNEFEVAQFADQGKYIRIYTPTNVFVKASYNTLNYALQFNPGKMWEKSTNKFKHFITRFNAQSSLQTSRKQVSDGDFHFNPFAGSVADTNLISLITSIANTVSFNRFSTNWGVDFTNVLNTNKAILTYGFETRKVNDYLLKIRKNIGRTLTTEITGKKGINQLVTPNPKFDNRNYYIDIYSLEPKFTFTKGSKFRAAVSYKYDDKKATTSTESPRSTNNAFTLDSKYNILQSGSLSGRLTYSTIKYNGTANNTLSYIMLDALQPGKNILWSLDFTKRLANALEIGFQYQGRKSDGTKAVHLGSASLRAIL